MMMIIYLNGYCTVNQLLLACEKLLRGLRELRCCKYFSPQTNFCRMVVITKTGVDMAWLRKLVVKNQIISCKWRNKVIANDSWFTVLGWHKIDSMFK